MTDANTTRVAVITGAAGGIGRATCEILAGRGWNVVAVDRDGDRLGWTNDLDGIEQHVADISTEEGNESMVAAATDAFGRLDCAVLNAGISKGGGIDDFDMAVFDEMWNVNVRGTAFGIHAALPALRAAGSGSIVINSSLHGIAGDVGFWAYSATKHALIGMVKSLARELGRDAIRINAVCPAAARTPMSEFIERDAPEVYDSIRAAIPLQRWSEANEIAQAIAFLASPEASFISGVALPVDGGTSAGSGLLPPLQ